ncbi:MAG: hypothetical protein QM723_27825 [Myxococcaceae bacterium]
MRTIVATFTLLLVGCSSYVCNHTSCPTGCCSGGSCYEGVVGHTGGVDCEASTGGGGGVGGGGSTGGGAGGGGSSTGGGGGTCGTYDDPCNASLPCCPPSGMYGQYCNSSRERCDLCGGMGYDCSDQYSEPCCPGFTCLLKPGFTSVYECQ